MSPPSTAGLGAVCRRLLQDLAQSDWTELDSLSGVPDSDPERLSEAVRHLFNSGYVVICCGRQSRRIRPTRRGRDAVQRTGAATS